MKIERVSLIGYSLAGNELTEFAIRYPNEFANSSTWTLPTIWGATRNWAVKATYCRGVSTIR